MVSLEWIACIHFHWFHSLQFGDTDEDNPQKGVIVKMSAIGLKDSCSLSVAVFCDRNEAQVLSCSLHNLFGFLNFLIQLRAMISTFVPGSHQILLTFLGSATM